MDECIVRTLSYYDVFDYPLTFSQIKKYLCCKNDLTDEELLEVLDNISVVHEFDGYYYLIGRSKLPSIRHDRQAISLQKHVKAKIIAKILSFIPTVEYIGESGSLSMNNASISDDIDLFIITKRNSLWVTRFTVNLLLMLINQKRRRSVRSAKDMICPNMFISKSELSLAKYGKSIYMAHEIVQLRTVFDRGGVYSDFISSNKWVRKHFPNIEYEYTKTNKKTTRVDFVLNPLDKLFYKLQYGFMKKRIQIEKVSLSGALFHPIDRKKVIMHLYNARRRMYLNLLSENSWIDNEEARFYLDEKKNRIMN